MKPDPITEELREMTSSLRALSPPDSIDAVTADLVAALEASSAAEREHGYARALGRLEAAVEMAVTRLRALASA